MNFRIFAANHLFAENRFMKINSCQMFRIGAAILLAFNAALACAQGYPNKPIKIIVPFGAGGIADFTARTVAQKMSESLGQQVIIDNRPSAGGIIASDAVAKAEPDGYTLLLMSNGSAVSVGLFKSLPFDTVKDFAPISILGFFDIALITDNDSRFKTLGELIAYAKANPGKLNIGTINVGSTQNLAAALFKSSAGIDGLIVPFRGTPLLITALRGGEIDVAVEILGPVMSQISSKSVRVLAVMGDRRFETMPDVPTVQESGIPNFNVASWNALAVPAKTPKDIIARLNKEVNAAVNAPAVKKRLAAMGVDARSGTPEQLQHLLAGEIKRWSEVIRRAKIEKQ
jgi:tripartite-type tricarboxylate transporter receptor subunit TctC